MTERDQKSGKVQSDLALELAFASAREAATHPAPDDLLARIGADADRRRPAPPVRRRTLGLREIFAAIGGWPALGGLVTASAAGLWLGVSQPALLEEYSLWPGATEISADSDLALILTDDYFAEFEEG